MKDKIFSLLSVSAFEGKGQLEIFRANLILEERTICELEPSPESQTAGFFAISSNMCLFLKSIYEPQAQDCQARQAVSKVGVEDST